MLRVKARGCGRQVLREIPALLVFGSLGAIMILFQMVAVRIALVSYVIAIKRAGMIFSILLGYFFFGERHLKVRMAGAALMVAGVCCIVL